jgi:hypothetical protein
MEMARRAKRAGLSFDVVSHGLKKENEKFIPAMQAEYNRFKPRKAS